MEAEKAHFEITRMARLLKVSRSGYYQWRVRRNRPGKRVVARGELDKQVHRLWEASDRTYGSPRICADLEGIGVRVNVKTVALSMVRQGIEGMSPRSFKPVTTLPGTSTHHVPDRVERKWDRGGLNRVWITDITYLPTREGFVYLCVITDAHSRRVIGWAMADHQRTDLVQRALKMAVTLRGKLPDDVVLHSDRGCQYTSGEFHETAVKAGISQSMGRSGVCWDNAMAESFWATLKTEFYNRRTWRSRAEAKTGVGAWIETRYNRSRRHSSINMHTPVGWEEKITMQDKQQQLRQVA